MIKRLLYIILPSACLLLCIQNSSAMPNKIKMSDILQMVQNENYHAISEIEYDHGLFEVDALDKNEQRVKIKISPDTGYLVKHPIIKTKLSLIEVAEKLEKKGYNIHEMELKKKFFNTYYEVKAANKNGQYRKLYIDANNGKLIKH